MHFYFIPLLISFLVISAKGEDDEEEVRVVHPSLCDTVECILLMKPSGKVTIKKKLSKHFTYVPSYPLTLLPNWTNFYDTPQTAEIMGHSQDKYLVGKLNHVFSLRLGRVQDIYYDRKNKKTVEEMVDGMIENTPFNIFNESGILMDEENNVCLDNHGFLTHNALKGYHCMSLIHTSLNFTEFFAGPSVWNRVDFKGLDRSLLRYMMSDGLMTLQNHARNSIIISKSSCPFGLKEDKCLTAYGLYQYISICCCVNGPCPREKSLAVFKKVRWCAFGSYSDEQPIRVYSYSMNSFVNKAEGDVCGLEVKLHRHKSKSKPDIDLKTRLFAYNYNKNDSMSDYIKFAVQRSHRGYACFHEMSKPRCPGFMKPADKDDKIDLKCYCDSSDMCAVKLAKAINFSDKDNTVLRTKNKTICHRKLFTSVVDMTSDGCLLYFDIKKFKFLNLEENNNFRVIRSVERLKEKLPKLGEITVTALAVEIYPTIFDAEASCEKKNIVYDTDETGEYTARIIYEISCSTDYCDNNITRSKSSVVKHLPFLYCIQWHHPPNYFYPRVGLLEVEMADIRKRSTLKFSAFNGYCYMEYTLVDDKSKNETKSGYVLRSLTTASFFDLDCPEVYDDDSDEMCMMTKLTKFSYGFCCRPLATRKKPKDRDKKAVNEYYDKILGFLQRNVKDITVLQTSLDIQLSLYKHGVCLVSEIVTDECPFYIGCYLHEVVKKDLIDKDSACTSIRMTGISLRNVFSSISICDFRISEFSLSRKYTDECLYIIAEGSDIQFGDDSQRSPQYICCCKQQSCGSLMPTKINYDMFLDENQDLLKNHLPGFDEF